MNREMCEFVSTSSFKKISILNITFGTVSIEDGATLAMRLKLHSTNGYRHYGWIIIYQFLKYS
jgi:hypothetical protein